MKITAAELTPTNIGKPITYHGQGVVVTGVLEGYDFRVDEDLRAFGLADPACIYISGKISIRNAGTYGVGTGTELETQE